MRAAAGRSRVETGRGGRTVAGERALPKQFLGSYTAIAGHNRQKGLRNPGRFRRPLQPCVGGMRSMVQSNMRTRVGEKRSGHANQQVRRRLYDWVNAALIRL